MASKHTVAAMNLAVDALADEVTEISLHTAAPNVSGSNEVTGGGYARHTTPVFDAAASGYASLSDPYDFNLTDETIVAVGYWLGATFGGYGELTSPRTIEGADTLTLQAFHLRLDGVTLLT